MANSCYLNAGTMRSMALYSWEWGTNSPHRKNEVEREILDNQYKELIDKSFFWEYTPLCFGNAPTPLSVLIASMAASLFGFLMSSPIWCRDGGPATTGVADRHPYPVPPPPSCTAPLALVPLN
jgi:hypothetical protein